MAKSDRDELGPELLKDWQQLALKGTVTLRDIRDKQQPYLVLRLRKHSLSWLVKTRDDSLKIGDAMPPGMQARLPERRKRASKAGDEYLGLRHAREKARRKWAELGNRVEVPEKRSCWTWGQLVDEYKKHISRMREDARGKPIYPSKETQSDVKGAFGRPAVERHSHKPLNELNEDWFEGVQEALHDDHGYDAYRKFRNYGRAALNWAQKFRRKESGLDGRMWWRLAEERRRTSDEVTAKIERDKKLKKKKAEFKVEHLGKLLAEHEKFCLSRSGNQRISPGVRWGLWWDCLTGHRRGSGTWITLEDVQFKDPLGLRGCRACIRRYLFSRGYGAAVACHCIAS